MKDIEDMFATFQREGERLIESILTLIYFMRGAISYTEAMNMSLAERELAGKFIERRLEVEKKNPSPVY